MRLLSKIKESLCGRNKPVEDEVKYVRKDLCVFATADFSVRGDKDYCFVGYYNADKTKVKDVLTGKVYRAGHSSAKTEDDGKKFFCVSYCLGLSGRDGWFKTAVLEPKTVLQDIMFQKEEFCSGIGWCSVTIGGRLAREFFVKTGDDDAVSESFIRGFVDELNERANQKLVKIEDTKRKVADTRKGYDTNF